MNHRKVITDVIDKYSDYPKTQSDMRKLIGYIESWFRMALTPHIKGLELTVDEPQEANNG